MRYQMYHGIEMAPNSTIVNMVAESLEADPTVVVAGRSWFNSTTGRMNFSSLDSTGAVIVESYSTKKELEALAKLEADHNKAVNDRAKAIEDRALALEGDRVRRDGTLAMQGNLNMNNNKINGLADGVADSDAVNFAQLKLAIANLGSVFEYVATIDASDATAANLDNVTRKEKGDTYRITKAGTVKWNSGAKSLYVNAGDMVIMGAAGWEKIDGSNTQVGGTTTFITVTGNDDTGYTVDIADEFKTRVTTLETGLAKEIKDRTDAVSGLDGRLKTVEDQVNGKIGNLTTLKTTAKDNMVNSNNELFDKIVQETTDRTAAVKDLRDKINAKKYSFLSAAAGTTHVVKHALATQTLLYSLMMQDTDGKFRNHTAIVEETDVNTYTITCTSPVRIKMVVESQEAV